MGWVDIVFICLIVIFAIVGICKGLFESILSIFSSALSIVVAILVSKHVAALLNKMCKANEFFSGLLQKWGWINADGATVFGKTYTAAQIGNACTVIISILAVWLLIKLVIWLLSKLFDNATSGSSALSGLNRVLGLIFGAAKGFLLGCVGLGLASILSICGVTGVKTLMEKNKMSNFVYGYVNEWVTKTLQDRIDDVLGKNQEGAAGDKTEGETPAETPTDSQEGVVTVTMSDGETVVVKY